MNKTQNTSGIVLQLQRDEIPSFAELAKSLSLPNLDWIERFEFPKGASLASYRDLLVEHLKTAEQVSKETHLTDRLDAIWGGKGSEATRAKIREALYFTFIDGYLTGRSEGTIVEQDKVHDTTIKNAPSSESEARLRQLIKSSWHCTVATSSRGGVPEAAEMLIAEAPENGIYLYTFSDSRKYRNFQTNPRAAVTIFNPPEYVQLDGEVVELAGTQAAEARDSLIGTTNGRVDYHEDPRSRYFIFHPQRVCLRVDQKYPAIYERWECTPPDKN